MAVWTGQFATQKEARMTNSLRAARKGRAACKGHRFAALLACSALFAPLAFGQATSQWVHYDRHGKLQYKTDTSGNRIIDYSSAGYRAGGVPLPKVAPRVTVTP